MNVAYLFVETLVPIRRIFYFDQAVCVLILSNRYLQLFEEERQTFIRKNL